ncbi:MAG: aminopeptidase P family protein [Calditrichaeota bacterium]|nr:aminopeptidase P family protein [Calditrichota bacterium]
MQPRLDALRRRFRPLGIANFIVVKFSDIHFKEAANIRYLCGFNGSNAVLLVTARQAYLITDGRYTNQAREQVTGAKVFTYKNGFSTADAFGREMKNNREIKFRGRIGFETAKMTFDMHKTLQHYFPNCPLVETSGVVEQIAAVKDETEITAIKRAVSITDEAFAKILPLLKPGVGEMDISAEITYQHKKLGADRDGFEPIVVSGVRSSLPHGTATTKKIAKGDFVTIDMGCLAGGYTADMTRTVVVGKATSEQKKVYALVLEAQQRACEAAQAGMWAKDLDKVARDIITAAGKGDYFTHGLGHGIGMEVHSAPRVGAQSKDKLAVGNVITIEPGVYIPDWGGVRIEDDVVVRQDSNEILNKSPKQLIEL